MLERLALEYQWRLAHGAVGDPDADPEQCIRAIMHYMSGILRRYKNRFSEAVLMDLLRKSCLSYASGSRKIGLVDTFLETVNAYSCQHRSKLPRRNKRSEMISTEAYKANGFESFTLRNNTSVPEVLAMNAHIPKPPENQTDEEISAVVDAILGVKSGDAVGDNDAN